MRYILFIRTLGLLMIFIGGLAALAQAYGFVQPIDSGAIAVYVILTLIMLIFSDLVRFP